MRLFSLAVGLMMAVSSVAPSLAYDYVAAGRKAWLQYNCYGCHGNNGAGGMGPNVQHSSMSDVSDAMKGGEKDGGMRSFAGIAAPTDPQSIAAYLATIGTTSEPKWLDWWNH